MRQRHMRLDVQRRLVLAAAAAGLSLPQQPALAQELSSKRVTWGPFKGMSDAELARLDELSKATNIGVMLAGSSGVRVIDLVWGDGPEPGAGQRICSLQDLGRRLPKRPCRSLTRASSMGRMQCSRLSRTHNLGRWPAPRTCHA